MALKKTRGLQKHELLFLSIAFEVGNINFVCINTRNKLKFAAESARRKNERCSLNTEFFSRLRFQTKMRFIFGVYSRNYMRTRKKSQTFPIFVGFIFAMQNLCFSFSPSPFLAMTSLSRRRRCMKKHSQNYVYVVCRPMHFSYYVFVFFMLSSSSSSSSFSFSPFTSAFYLDSLEKEHIFSNQTKHRA